MSLSAAAPSQPSALSAAFSSSSSTPGRINMPVNIAVAGPAPAPAAPFPAARVPVRAAVAPIDIAIDDDAKDESVKHSVPLQQPSVRSPATRPGSAQDFIDSVSKFDARRGRPLDDHQRQTLFVDALIPAPRPRLWQPSLQARTEVEASPEAVDAVEEASEEASVEASEEASEVDTTTDIKATTSSRAG